MITRRWTGSDPRSSLRAMTLLPAIVLMGACASAPRSAQDEDDDVRPDAIILSGPALEDGRGSVLDAMRHKTPSLRVRQDIGECPRITLRNDVSFMSQVNPLIYVDGMRALDTCILESVRGSDVEIVEIYPRGVTTRPGYDMHPYGLILLFMRS